MGFLQSADPALLPPVPVLSCGPWSPALLRAYVSCGLQFPRSTRNPAFLWPLPPAVTESGQNSNIGERLGKELNSHSQAHAGT